MVKKAKAKKSPVVKSAAAKPAAKPAKAAKVAKAAKPAAKPAKGRVDRGEADYAVQAKKMKALIETLGEAVGDLAEAKVLKEMARRGFAVHPRTLARETERLKVLGYNVAREATAEGIVYRLTPDPKVADAIAAIEGVRKEVRKAGLSTVDKALAAAIKSLKT